MEIHSMDLVEPLHMLTFQFMEEMLILIIQSHGPSTVTGYNLKIIQTFLFLFLSKNVNVNFN